MEYRDIKLTEEQRLKLQALLERNVEGANKIWNNG